MADSKPQGSGGPPQNRGKKRFKSYYVRSKEGKRIRKDTMLTVGMRGILLTCNHGVNPCVKEAYNLLSEYAEKLYGPEKDEKEEGDEKAQGTEEAEEEEDGKINVFVIFEKSIFLNIYLMPKCILSNSYPKNPLFIHLGNLT